MAVWGDFSQKIVKKQTEKMRKLNLEEVEKIISKCPNYRISRFRKNRYSKFSEYIEIPSEFPDLPPIVYNIRKKVAEKLKK